MEVIFLKQWDITYCFKKHISNEKQYGLYLNNGFIKGGKPKNRRNNVSKSS